MTDEFAHSGDNSTPSAAPSTAPTSTPVTDPLVGTLIAERYTVERRLARGGMATVYVAHDQRLDREIAIKVMHPHLAEDAQFISRFDREARSAARISHPAVVSVTDQGSVDGRPFLVMDLIDGPNLRDMLRSQGAFSLRQCLNYTRDVLQALRAASREGVIHRDIKPENVMVPSDGPVRVTDFGLAKAVSEATMSATSNMLGTVTYMAPEIATTGKADGRTDLYSLGIMLFEMLTGAVPWHGDNALHIAYSHVHDDVPSPSSEQPWIPREVDDFVAALTARKPDERPASAAEALVLLERLMIALPAELLEERAAVAPLFAGAETQVIAQSDGALAPTAFLPAMSGESSEPLSPSVSESSAASSAGGSRPRLLPQALSSRHTPVGASGSADAEPGHGGLDSRALGGVALSDGVEEGVSADASVRSGKEKRSAKRRIFVIVALVCALVLAAGGGGTWWWFEFGPGAYIELPQTDSRPASEVRAELEKLGFSVSETEEFSDDVPVGLVISSVPASATSAHKDAVITLIVSKGVDLRVVPNIVGVTREEGQKALDDVGLTVGEVDEVWSEDVPAGHVISQAQQPESMLRVDSAVDFVVSKGREPRTVPELVGKTKDEVGTALSQLELTAEFTEAFSDDVPAGTVISQETAAGTELFRGDKVQLTVSKGPELAAVPEISGMSRQEAVNALEAAGFKVEVNYLLGGIFGTAHSTDPKSGTMLKKGSTVTLTVV